MSQFLPGKPFHPASGVRFILASSSPRRKAMLTDLGLIFTSLPAKNEEALPEHGETGHDFAKRASFEKAASVFKNLPQPISDSLALLAADTVVCVDNIIMGKPANAGGALDMLRLLNGKTHIVHTAITLFILKNGEFSTENFAESTRVEFAEWPDAVLAAYARGEEPLDKAGGYAIQGCGAFLIKGIVGSWSNVVGLPLERLTQTLLAQQLIVPAE